MAERLVLAAARGHRDVYHGHNEKGPGVASRASFNER